MENLSNVLLSLYRTSHELAMEDFADAALNLVKPLLPFDSCTWGTGAVTQQGLQYHHAHLHQEHPDRLGLYEEIKAQDTVAFNVARNIGSILSFHFPTLYARPDKAGIREYVQRVRHLNGLYTSQSHVTRLSDWVHWIALFRADSDHQFNKNEAQLYHVLGPHLMQAQAVNRKLHLERMRATDTGRNMHLAIADRGGVLHLLEPGAAEMLRREWPGWNGAILPHTLRDVLEGRAGNRYVGREVMINIGRIAGVWFLKMRHKLPVDGLTAREKMVAKHIVEGLTYKQIAAVLHIAPVTVRNHIQNIHARLGVSNNAELAAQLNAAEGGT